MKLALMQPYFFPYIGYFSLIKYTDQFIIFDTAQYIRRGWIHRNRILNENKGYEYFNVPTIKMPQKTAINNIQINHSTNWKMHILTKLNIYKNLAPNYKNVIELVEKCLSYETKSLSELNIFIIKEICKKLNIPIEITKTSNLNINLNEINEPDDWGVQISKAFNAKEYVNASGGINLYSPKKYESENLRLKFLKNNLQSYDQKTLNFEPGLSIIDVMMFNDNEQIHEMLDDITIL